MSWAALFKTAKNIATFIEVVDAMASTATLGDEIARAAMGDDYDPAFRDKCQEVANAGKAVDALVTTLKARQRDVDNLSAGVEQLNLTLQLYDDKNEIVVELIDKIGAFRQSMSLSPTAMTWVLGAVAQTDAHLTQEDTLKRLDDVQSYMTALEFDPLNTGLTSASLALKGALTAYRWRELRKERRKEGRNPDVVDLDDNDIPMQPRTRDRRNAFSGMEMLPKDQQKAIKKLRRGVTKAKVVDVVSKAGSALSLAYTIYGIINRVSQRNEAFAEFEKQLVEYAKANHAYDYCIRGWRAFPEDPAVKKAADALAAVEAQAAATETAEGDSRDPGDLLKRREKAADNLAEALRKNDNFVRARDFFTAGSTLKWDRSDEISFAEGVEGLAERYSKMGDAKIAAMRSMFSDMIEILTGEKNHLDQWDEKLRRYVKGEEVLKEVIQYKNDFEYLASIASNRLHPSQKRKDNGFVPMQKTFDDTLQTLLSHVIADAADMLRSLRFASTLYATAQDIVDDAARTAANKAAADAKDLANNANFARAILMAKGQVVTDAAIKQTIASILGNSGGGDAFDEEAFVAAETASRAKRDWVQSDVDTQPTKKFATESAAVDCLKLMVAELRQAVTTERSKAA